MTAAGVPEGELIGRCYTKARRTPLVVGSVHGGLGRNLRLPFGPYTVTQLATVILTTGALLLTRPVWGGHGLLDLVVLITLPISGSLAMRHLHIDGRNPAAALASVTAMLAGPRRGRLRGRAYRAARRQVSTTAFTVTTPAAPAAELAPERAPSSTVRPAPRGPRPTATRSGDVPVISGAQALLARRAVPTSGDR